MKCPACNEKEFGYFTRMLMAFWGPIRCNNCNAIVRVKPPRFSLKKIRFSLKRLIPAIIFLAIFLIADHTTALIAFFILFIVILIDIPSSAILVSEQKVSKVKLFFLQIYRYVLFIPGLIFFLLIPVYIVLLFTAPPVIKKNVDLSILNPAPIHQDARADAMKVIAGLPTFSTSDSCLLCWSYSNHYATNKRLNEIILEGYQRILPLSRCTFIDTATLSRDTSEFNRGDLTCKELSGLSVYFKLLMIKLNSDMCVQRFADALEDFSLGLHLSSLIGKADIDIVSASISISYGNRAITIVQDNITRFTRFNEILTFNSVIKKYTFDNTAVLNGLRKTYNADKRMLISAFSEKQKSDGIRLHWIKIFPDKFWDLQETLEINAYIWARLILAASLPEYSKDTIERYEYNLLNSYAKDPFSFRLTIYPNTIGRMLVSIAPLKLQDMRYRVITLLRRQTFLENLLAIQTYRIEHKVLPTNEEFIKLNVPDDPRTLKKFLYDSDKMELHAEIDTMCGDTLRACLQVK